MNKDILEGKWKQVRGEAKAWWGKLTDNDLERVAVRRIPGGDLRVGGHLADHRRGHLLPNDGVQAHRTLGRGLHEFLAPLQVVLGIREEREDLLDGRIDGERAFSGRHGRIESEGPS